MTEFNFDDAAVALEMRKVERRGGGVDDMRHTALKGIAHQLHAAGAPDAPFEQQARELLGAYRALAEAGEEMPCADALDAVVVKAMFAGKSGVHAALDLFAPILARRTQERDLARLGLDTNAQEVDALRQRAERAERERNETVTDRDAAIALRQVDKRQNDILRARIAELEASREPGADVVERLDDAYEAAYTGARERSHRERCRAGIRAVLSHLAAMGEEAWPSEDEIIKASLAGERYVDKWQNILSLFRSRLSPVIGALRAKVAELEAEIARHRNAAELQSSGLVVLAKATPDGYTVTPLPYHVHEVKSPNDGTNE